MALGKQIRKYRKLFGLTLDAVAIESGVDIGTISALEQRDSSKSNFFLPIAKALGLTLEQLADESQVHTSTTKKPVTKQVMAAPVGNVTDINHSVREDVPAWGTAKWPFVNVQPHQFELLSYEERMHVESGILLRIKGREPPAKKPKPAPSAAAA